MIEQEKAERISPESPASQLLRGAASALSEGGRNQVMKFLDNIDFGDPRYVYVETVRAGLESSFFLPLGQIRERNRKRREQDGKPGPNCSLTR